MEAAGDSGTEEEILALLRRPARDSPSIRELRRKLLPFFTELQLQNAVSNLLEKGLATLVYNKGCGLVLRPQHKVSV